jgi:hypothetical protein
MSRVYADPGGRHLPFWAYAGDMGTRAQIEQLVAQATAKVPNGDVNPYGVAVVGRSQGAEVAGDVLVSNFNSGPPPAGLQGRGTTIV